MFKGLGSLWFRDPFLLSVLGGSWAAISRVRSRRTKVIIHITGLITPLVALSDLGYK